MAKTSQVGKHHHQAILDEAQPHLM
ncbi:hypothetical protein CCACVL1_04067 [Corchorus capsularis]|uniref:Uncharacterized protein n=1 Tax=Corchorus capsularis TaxID=210143 RepID=A0A1R3JVG3_COCAP|nr:hypothetical protein CCACVL1_04067 [Corchorus capsularis]